MADFVGSNFKVFGQIGVIPRHPLKLLGHVATRYAASESSRPFRLLPVMATLDPAPVIFLRITRDHIQVESDCLRAVLSLKFLPRSG